MGKSHMDIEPSVPLQERELGLTLGAVRVGRSRIHGRGVFAMQNYGEGDVIELCPGLILDEASSGLFKDFTMLCNEKAPSESQVDGRVNVIALGFGPMYNHNSDPNVD